MKEKGVQIIFIDYLHLISNKEADKLKKSTNDRIGDITKRLKALAKRLNIPIIQLSQLSRLGKELSKTRSKTIDPFIPTLEDLRDSGSIEQDSDIVIFLVRYGYYKKQLADYQPWMDDNIKIVCAKFRNGATFDIDLTWKGEFAKIEENIESYPEALRDNLNTVVPF